MQRKVKRPMNQDSSVFLLSSNRRQQLCELRTGERTLRLDRAVAEALHQTLLHTQCNRISAVRRDRACVLDRRQRLCGFRITHGRSAVRLQKICKKLHRILAGHGSRRSEVIAQALEQTVCVHRADRIRVPLACANACGQCAAAGQTALTRDGRADLGRRDLIVRTEFTVRAGHQLAFGHCIDILQCPAGTAYIAVAGRSSRNFGRIRRHQRLIARAVPVQYIGKLLKRQQIFLCISSAGSALVFVVKIGYAFRADARIAVQINRMIVRQQLLDRLDVVTGQQVVQCVLRAGVQVKRQTVIPDR